MPTQTVKITIAQPQHLIDYDAVKLAAKKTIIPGATDSHGCRVLSTTPIHASYTAGVPRSFPETSNDVVVEVTT